MLKRQIIQKIKAVIAPVEINVPEGQIHTDIWSKTHLKCGRTFDSKYKSSKNGAINKDG